jgi:probable F420-dependent oxidoreductase
MAQPPFRFGVQLGASDSGTEWLRLARRAEELGYDIAAVGDHLAGPDFTFGAALGAIAAATTTLRVGTLVLVNDYRHPVVVAKEAATLDVLSAGRFELGLGAGWIAEDFAHAGIPFDPPGIRVSRFAESVQVIADLLTGGAVTFAGRHYNITDLTNAPPCHQRPRPPLLIGAAGKRMVSLAAQRADVISLLPRIRPSGTPVWTDLTATGIAEKVAWARQAAPQRATDLQLHMLVQAIAITDDWRRAAAPIAARWDLPIEEIRASPLTLLGTEDEIVDLLQTHRSHLGLAYFSVKADQMEPFAPVIARLAGQ